MWYIIGSVVFLGIISAIAGYIYNRKLNKMLERGEISEIPEAKELTSETECCGQHETCEKDSLLAAISKTIEYYDDEELDRFKRKSGDEYSEDEIEEFREVLYTLKEDEVAGWLRSLMLRDIELPNGLKDEAFLIVGERRIH
jgi:tRNA(Glu) U13 pseudouridine synthase TruD